MTVPIVIPDASVLLKWVLPSEEEPHADNALLMRSAILESTIYALVPPLGYTKWATPSRVAFRSKQSPGYPP